MAAALPRVGIALGDPAGVGPEIALKAALDPRVTRVCQPVLFGDPAVLEKQAALCGIKWSKNDVELVALEHFASERLEIGQIRAAHGRAAVDAARAAINAALHGEVAAVVAAPHTELAIKQAGFEFDGYPSFVARCTGVAPEDAFLMICFDATRIVHATLHLSLRRAIELVTPQRLGKVLRSTHDTLERLGVKKPRIAVSGLNPHAGESGLFGSEEIETIAPAIEAARREGIAADGPYGADILFHRTGYDAFLVMFHDQGHIAAKLQAPNRAAGMTIGTPVLFSSVAHGSALDIAGQGRAKPDALIEAIARVTGVPI
jgi:4-hydroxythreonine-4-phosphate dehydrogenase